MSIWGCLSLVLVNQANTLYYYTCDVYYLLFTILAYKFGVNHSSCPVCVVIKIVGSHMTRFGYFVVFYGSCCKVNEKAYLNALFIFFAAFQWTGLISLAYCILALHQLVGINTLE